MVEAARFAGAATASHHHRRDEGDKDAEALEVEGGTADGSRRFHG